MTSRSVLPLPLAGEGRGEGKPLWVAFVFLFSTLAACGNYSNEDLEYMNAVPARVDIAAVIPRSLILPANEAELSRLTHDVITTFNGALVFLEAADVIRRYQPTSRIQNGRVWGPGQMEEHPDWQWRFIITRDPAAPEMFSYAFEVQLIGGGDVWIPFIEGTFVATGGVRKGMGHFHIGTDGLRAAGFPVDVNAKGELLKDLDVMYSTAAFPISTTMHMVLCTDALAPIPCVDTVMIDYHHEAQSNGQGAMEFSGTDSKTGWTLSIVSRWMSTGTGRADARAVNGAGVDMTRTQCWDDSFRQTYDYTPWDQPPDPIEEGDITLCPDISTL